MTTGNLNLDIAWGPFSNTYLGISRILDSARGTMADLALSVARRAPAAAVLADNDFGYGPNFVTGDRRTSVQAVPEDVAPDYSAFAIRYYLDWQGDTVLARFRVETPERVQCDLSFQNTSGEKREYSCGMGLLVSDARKAVRLKPALKSWWLPARNYSEIEAYQRVQGTGCRQCLSRVFNWGIEDEVLAQAFGGWSGDRVVYRMKLPEALRDGHLYFRYVKYGAVDHPWEIKVNETIHRFHFPRTWSIPGGAWGKNRDAYAEWRLLRVPVGALPAGDIRVELQPNDPPGNDQARIWLDGILFHEGRLPGDDGSDTMLPTSLTDDLDADTVRVELESATDREVRLRIKVPDAVDQTAVLATSDHFVNVHPGTGSFLADARQRLQMPAVPLERDASVLPWVGWESDVIAVPPHAERTVRFTLEISAPGSPGTVTNGHVDAMLPELPHGPYAELAARMRDALLFDINYPLPIFDRITPYYVPAKHFPLPYSWDGGFAALGMATFAPDLAWRQTAFFMADAHHDFPMLYCGSPVPTPIYALWDVLQQTQDTAALGEIYPGAKRMHDFYLGRTPGSVVHAAGDGLLSTYPYNYNLGIDDHPIQRWAEERHLTRQGLYSIILMPQVLRNARILRNVAHMLGYTEDAALFGRDVALLGDVIEQRMWDEDSGLYGWLCRNGQGQVEAVRMDNCAGDRSACAFLPLFGGLTARKDRLIEHMRNPARFQTPHGISSVDMAAPSYNPHGYWNGAVWPVMQWYIWRGLLEAGEPALARRVAETILNTWQSSFTKERYLGEHFVLRSALMCGAPNFGGLSAVLLPMHAAYFIPYQVTSLYDVIIRRRTVDSTRDMLTLVFDAPFLEQTEHDLLINMGRSSVRYAVTLNGRFWGEAVADAYGHLQLRLPRPEGSDSLVLFTSQ